MININNIDVFVFDFDGVMTNNLVYVNSNGVESVACSRADGLAFDVLRKLKKKVYILSTEKDLVVSMRAGKLKVPVIQGVHDKLTSLKDLAHKENFEFNRIFFIGNDLNDYFPMVRSGYSACPFDSHEKIKEVATYVLEVNGGEGVARELLENIFNLDFLHILYGGSST